MFFSHLNSRGQVLFKNIYFVAICAFFLEIIEEGHSKNVSNVIDLIHNKKIEGGQLPPPPGQPVSMPDVRQNRIYIFMFSETLCKISFS